MSENDDEVFWEDLLSHIRQQDAGTGCWDLT